LKAHHEGKKDPTIPEEAVKLVTDFCEPEVKKLECLAGSIFDWFYPKKIPEIILPQRLT